MVFDFYNPRSRDDVCAFIFEMECVISENFFNRFMSISHHVNKKLIVDYVLKARDHDLRHDLARFHSGCDWSQEFVFLPFSYDSDLKIPINASIYQELVLRRLHNS